MILRDFLDDIDPRYADDPAWVLDYLHHTLDLDSPVSGDAIAIYRAWLGEPGYERLIDEP